MLDNEVKLELWAVKENLAILDVEMMYPAKRYDGGGKPSESCITSSITEAEVRSRFEEVRPYLYAKGRNGENSETQYLLSKALHSFTHET